MAETLTTDVPDDLQARIQDVLERACESERPPTTAESCTGGPVASLFNDVDGASRAFERGYVVSTNEAEMSMPGVQQDLRAAHGAVSRPVAIARANGALARSRAYSPLPVTRFAGAAGDNEEGLVPFACAVRGRETTHREEHFGSIGRGAVRLACLRIQTEMSKESLR